MQSFFYVSKKWASPPPDGVKPGNLFPGNHIVKIYSRSTHDVQIMASCYHQPNIFTGGHDANIYTRSDHNATIWTATDHIVNIWTS